MFLILISPLFGIAEISNRGIFDITNFLKIIMIAKMKKIGITPILNHHIFTIKGGISMTENEKKLLQAKHRLEEAQARDRVKERKARTRRLIQEGAILEKVFPNVSSMELDELEYYLYKIAAQI